MPGVISPQPRIAIPSPAVLPLRSTDIPSLRLPSRQSVEQMRTALVQRPDRSVWIPDTLEYAIVGCWRNRQEISSLDDLTAVRNVASLVQAAADRSFQQGDELLLAVARPVAPPGREERGGDRLERLGGQPAGVLPRFELFEGAEERGRSGHARGSVRVADRGA